MHKLMRRTLVSLSLLALPVVANASGARVSGLNVPGDYVKDYTGIYTYVSGVGSVGNLVWAEPGNGGNNAMGAVLGNLWDGKLGTFGLTMRAAAPSLGQPMFGDPVTTSLIGAGDFNFNGEALDLMWGHKMGSGSLGLRVNRSFISNELAAGTAEGNGQNGRNIWGIGAGFGFAMNSNTDVEISGLFQNRSFKGTNFNTPDAAEDDGGSTYQIAARAMKKSGSNVVLIPAVKMYSFGRSFVDAAAVTTDETISGWSFGLAGNWTLGSDDLFILGGNFVGNKFEQTVGANPTQTVTETFYPNMFMALETHTNSWLTLRFGAQNAVMFSAKQEIGPNTQTVKQHVFSFSTGATVKAGSLMFDATLTPQFFNNPVSATFNNGLGNNPFGRVSATYSF